MRNTTPKTAILALAAAFATLSVAAVPASALPRQVTAQSRYGNGTVTGAVRINRQGYPEVRTPSGAWIDCEGDCREALRVRVLDFWETFQEESGDSDFR